MNVACDYSSMQGNALCWPLHALKRKKLWLQKLQHIHIEYDIHLITTLPPRIKLINKNIGYT